MSVSRKNNRLSLKNYSGKQIVFITINTAGRSIIFIEKNIVNDHLAILQHTAAELGFDVPAYCFMPDHLHLLVVGKHEKSELISFIKKFKQVTGFSYKQKIGRILWQKSFYDHILRKQENMIDCAEYILANPVREKIAERMRDYPYSGSLVYGDEIFDGLDRVGI